MAGAGVDGGTEGTGMDDGRWCGRVGVAVGGVAVVTVT